jgi:Meiotically up-regulated gene 113
MNASAAQSEFPVGVVYFLELPSLSRIKIGSTCNLSARLKSLAAIWPEPPVLLGSISGGASEEMRWHARWSHLRAYREWFKADDELREAIAVACRSGSTP